jgi:hypothetical protein
MAETGFGSAGQGRLSDGTHDHGRARPQPGYPGIPAERVHPGAAAAWRVSWLPGRALTRGQAVTAMMIAQAAGRIPAGAGPGTYDSALRGAAWTRGRPNSASRALPPWRGHLSRLVPEPLHRGWRPGNDRATALRRGGEAAGRPQLRRAHGRLPQ